MNQRIKQTIIDVVYEKHREEPFSFSTQAKEINELIRKINSGEAFALLVSEPINTLNRGMIVITK